jgi:hypothetical protein
VDVRLGRRVALKILSGEVLTHPTARSRMALEGAALARIRHDNVIGIYDVLDHEGHLVLVLELVEGESLATRISRGPLPAAEAVWIALGVLRGLAAIHAANLVHRDIKPGNILLTTQGAPKVADLGVAHDGQRPPMTRTGSRLGTPQYMSPEQIRGHVVDARSDIYAAGIVLYEMLTGSVPFDAESEYDVLTAQVSAPPDLGKLDGRAPEGLVRAVSHALEKEPAKRWQTADEFAGALAVDHSAASVFRREHPADSGWGHPAAPSGAAPIPSSQIHVRAPSAVGAAEKPPARTSLFTRASIAVAVLAIVIGAAHLVGTTRATDASGEPLLDASTAPIQVLLPPSLPPPVPKPAPAPEDPCEGLSGGPVYVVRQPTAEELRDALAAAARVQGEFTVIQHYQLSERHEIGTFVVGAPFFTDKLYPSQVVLCAIVKPVPR